MKPLLTETSTVVSTFTPDAPADSCPLDAPTESPDIHKCQEFVEKTCGCHLANGRPCSRGVAYVNVCISRHLKEELAWAIDKWLWLIINIMLFKTVIPLRI